MDIMQKMGTNLNLKTVREKATTKNKNKKDTEWTIFVTEKQLTSIWSAIKIQRNHKWQCGTLMEDYLEVWPPLFLKTAFFLHASIHMNTWPNTNPPPHPTPPPPITSAL